MLATTPRGPSSSSSNNLVANPMPGPLLVPRRQPATWTECPHTLSGLPCMNHQPHAGNGRGCVHHSTGMGDDE